MSKPRWHMRHDAPDLLSDAEKKRLARYWETTVAPRVENKIGKGHAADALLMRTIDTIRDGYFQLFAERRYLHNALKLEPNDPSLLQKLTDLKHDELLHTNQSITRLMEPGFDYYRPKQRAHYDEIKNFSGVGKPLTAKQAASTMGTLIGGSLDAFQSLNRFYKLNKTSRMEIDGRISMLATPKTLDIERSQPRTSWVKSLQKKIGRER